MLKNISPLLTPELLFGLAKLGHGDDVALVDANFPADRIAKQAHARLVQLPGLSTTQVLQAVLEHLRANPVGDSGQAQLEAGFESR